QCPVSSVGCGACAYDAGAEGGAFLFSPLPAIAREWAGALCDTMAGLIDGGGELVAAHLAQGIKERRNPRNIGARRRSGLLSPEDGRAHSGRGAGGGPGGSEERRGV